MHCAKREKVMQPMAAHSFYEEYMYLKIVKESITEVVS
jgi:hypothetical protein